MRNCQQGRLDEHAEKTECQSAARHDQSEDANQCSIRRSNLIEISPNALSHDVVIHCGKRRKTAIAAAGNPNQTPCILCTDADVAYWTLAQHDEVAHRIAPMASAMPATLCEPRLSITTISPGCSTGTSACCTQARNAAPLIVPSSTQGATKPRVRRAQTKVVVCQWP